MHVIVDTKHGMQISIHAPRVGSDDLQRRLSICPCISIHAPRVGSDCTIRWLRPILQHFNPRSPCGERPGNIPLLSVSGSFQSTLPVWGATIYDECRYVMMEFQSTLPVWGATPTKAFTSSRAKFQSTLPVWGATRGMIDLAYRSGISIHAPRVGSDVGIVRMKCLHVLFQSTLPVWGATALDTEQ